MLRGTPRRRVRHRYPVKLTQCRLARVVTQPEHPLTGEVAHRRPHWPARGGRAQQELLVGQGRHGVAQERVVRGPGAESRADRLQRPIRATFLYASSSSRYAPRAVRLESRSCSSVVTIVAKFGQCFSASTEKKVPPRALTTSTLAKCVLMYSASSSCGTTSGSPAAAMIRRYRAGA